MEGAFFCITTYLMITYYTLEGALVCIATYDPVTIKDMQNPPTLRSGHLDIKDAQRSEKMMNVKFHTTSYRVWAP